MESTPKTAAHHSESLARGLLVIRAFGRDHARMRPIDIANKTGISRAAARRFLLTLQDLGYVGSDGEFFYLRPRVLDLGFSYLNSIGVENLVQPVLDHISEQTEATSSFAVLDHYDVVIVARASTNSIFQLATPVGGRIPTHATSLGQVLLAGLPPSQLEEYLASDERKAFTQSTIVDAESLKHKLAEIRRDGYALSVSEQFEGIVAVAVPVHNTRGEVVAAANINMYPASADKIDDAKRHVAMLKKEVRELESAMQANQIIGMLGRN